MTTTSQALEAKAEHPAVTLQRHYAQRLASLVPSHVNGEAWVRQATGALREQALADAAMSDFGSFVTAVERAAVLGLRPNSEEYYLVPRRKGGRNQVMGIVGWQGLVDLMYRSGAVSSVIAETVHTGDQFTYQPGLHDRPQHVIDWDAEDRGPLRLVYAYAVMKDGSTSKVVVLNKADIDRIKQSSDGAGSQYSPWVKHEAAMWLKSAVRQLAKWVPTSVEHMAQTRQAEHVAARVIQAPEAPAVAQVPEGRVALTTGELLDDEYDPTTEDGFGDDAA